MGYRQSQGDHTRLIKNSKLGRVIVFLSCIDGITATRNNEEEKVTLREEIKELEMLKYLLKVKVVYSKLGIFIPQR